MRKKAVLIGSYQKALALSQSLQKKGFRITIINDDHQSCVELAECDGVTVIYGDATRPYTLEDAEVRGADVAIALTRRDDDNLVICELCKKIFGVKKTISLVNDPKKISFFYSMGVDSVVCSITTVTNVIEQHAFVDEISSIVSIGEGRVNVTQVRITPKARSVGKKISQLGLPKQVIIGCILRGQKNIIPQGGTSIRAGDLLVLISADSQDTVALQHLIGR